MPLRTLEPHKATLLREVVGSELFNELVKETALETSGKEVSQPVKIAYKAGPGPGSAQAQTLDPDQVVALADLFEQNGIDTTALHEALDAGGAGIGPALVDCLRAFLYPAAAAPAPIPAPAPAQSQASQPTKLKPNDLGRGGAGASDRVARTGGPGAAPRPSPAAVKSLDPYDDVAAGLTRGYFTGT